MKIEGYGYEWDAELIGGPADGCIDRAVQLNGKCPPNFLIKILDGEEIRRESLGEKLIEIFTIGNLDENQNIAVYKLTIEPEEIDSESDACSYKYIETIKFGIYKNKYESKTQ